MKNNHTLSQADWIQLAFLTELKKYFESLPENDELKIIEINKIFLATRKVILSSKYKKARKRKIIEKNVVKIFEHILIHSGISAGEHYLIPYLGQISM